jgi:hypothetical protein
MITKVFSLLVFGAILQVIFCFFDVELTDGRAIQGTDVNFDGLRVRKINHSVHAAVGSFETLVELDDTYDVNNLSIIE